MSLSSQLESILFVASKPLSVKNLAKFLEKPEADIQSALLELQQSRRDSGVIVLEANGVWQMATQADNVEVVKDFLNSDLREKLTEATLEVLAIIAYRQPISKAEIEAIRGVNSQYSIRHLLMRGMIEKISNPNDARGSLYQVTTEFLQHLGLQSIHDLPEFEKLVAHIKLPETPAVQAETANPEDPVETAENAEAPESAENEPGATAPAETNTEDKVDEDEEDEFEDDDEGEDEDEDEDENKNENAS